MHTHSLACPLTKLSTVCRPLCGCGACHRTRNYTFGHIAEDTCGCNTAALALTVGLSKRDIVYVSYHNEVSVGHGILYERIQLAHVGRAQFVRHRLSGSLLGSLAK